MTGSKRNTGKKKYQKPAAKKRSAKKEAGKAKTEKLTLKEEAFEASLPACGWNATEAARAAGYQGSDATLAVIGHQNLRKHKIATRVRARIEGLAATADEVLALLGEHLRADLADLVPFIKPDGELDLQEAQKHGVSRQLKAMTTTVLTRKLSTGVEEREVRTRFELHDAQSAAAHLVKVLGIAQKAAENKNDVDRKAKGRAEAIKLAMETYDCSEDEAIRILSAMPEASDLVQ